MRTQTILLLLYTFCVTFADLQAPLADQQNVKSINQDRKSSAIGDDNSDKGNSKTDDDNDAIIEPNEEDTISRLMAEELVYHGNAIKIIKAPDLSQEKEAQKMSEMLSTLVNSHAKLIKKLEDEIEEMDGSIASLGIEPEQVLTQDDIELESIYEDAMKILNRTRSDKAEGFALLKRAADQGHAKSQAMISWAQLMGNHVDMNFEEAKKTFLQLADTGFADAHMVCINAMCGFRSRLTIQILFGNFT